MSVARRLVGGSALRVVSLLLTVFVTFYMYPFLVHSLGDHWYGFWVIAAQVVGYYSVFDLGLTPAVHRYLAMAHSRNDREETNTVYSTALGVFTIGAGVALVLTGLVYLLVPYVVAAEDVATARPLVLLLGVNFALAIPNSLYNGILAANLRYDISAYLQMARLTIRTGVVIAAFQNNPSIVKLAWITLGVDFATNVATHVAARRLWPWVRWSPHLFKREKVMEFFHYGFFSFLVRIGDLVRFGVDSVIIAKFLSVATVTHYGIAMRLTDSFNDVLLQGVSVMTPVFARYHALGDKEAMFRAVRQVSRLAVAFAVTLAGAAIIFGHPFIARWMGPNYLDAYVPLVLLISAALAGAMQITSNAFLYAIARHRYYAVLNGLDAVLNLVLSLILVRKLGMIGVAVGTLIPAVLVKVILQPHYVGKHLGISFGAYWADLARVFFGTLAMQAPIAAIVWYVQPSTYPSIIGLALGLYALHGLALYLVVLRHEDQHVLANAVPPLHRLIAMRQRLAGAQSTSSH